MADEYVEIMPSVVWGIIFAPVLDDVARAVELVQRFRPCITNPAVGAFRLFLQHEFHTVGTSGTHGHLLFPVASLQQVAGTIAVFDDVAHRLVVAFGGKRKVAEKFIVVAQCPLVGFHHRNVFRNRHPQVGCHDDT